MIRCDLEMLLDNIIIFKVCILQSLLFAPLIRLPECWIDNWVRHLFYFSIFISAEVRQI